MKYEDEGNAINGAVVAILLYAAIGAATWLSVWCYHQAVGR